MSPRRARPACVPVVLRPDMTDRLFRFRSPGERQPTSDRVVTRSAERQDRLVITGADSGMLT